RLGLLDEYSRTAMTATNATYTTNPPAATQPADQPGGAVSDNSQRANPTGPTVMYTVQEGDTLADIAARYSTSASALAGLNYLSDPAQLRPGQELKVPDRGPGGVSQLGQTSAGVGAGSTTRVYRVQPGETLAEIAIRLGTTTAEIARLNSLANPGDIAPGQELLVPA